jgi:hypothetical protein
LETLDHTLIKSAPNDDTQANDESSQVIPLLPFPKVMKKDIRRMYSNMFANVSNSGDIRMTEGFFSDFSTFNMTCIVKASHSPYPDVPTFMKIDGLAVFLQFWYNRIQVVPDMCYRVSDAKVVTFRDSEESRVECAFELFGTRIFDVPFDTVLPSEEETQIILANAQMRPTRQEMNKKRKKLSLNRNASSLSTAPTTANNDSKVSKKKLTKNSEMLCQQSNTSTEDISDIISSLNEAHVYDDRVLNTVSNAKMHQKPLEIQSFGVVTMWLDANRAITKIEFRSTH